MADCYAVLGSPIKHSLSPLIFKLFAEQTGQALEYQAILVKPEDLASKLVQLRDLGFKGVNLTTPLKEQALSLVAVCSPRACSAKAINILSFREDIHYYGDNSDGLGFIRDLTQIKKYSVQAKSVLILGAGGAARGIMSALLEAKPRHVTVANRNQEKAMQLIGDFWQHRIPLSYIKWSEIDQNTYDLVIQCTSAGLQGQVLALPNDILNEGACCYDLAYGVAAQGFLDWAKEQGATLIHDGLGMLVEQAAEAFYIWRQARVNTVPILNSLS